jgi:hypothetical protein
VIKRRVQRVTLELHKLESLLGDSSFSQAALVSTTKRLEREIILRARYADDVERTQLLELARRAERLATDFATAARLLHD